MKLGALNSILIILILSLQLAGQSTLTADLPFVSLSPGGSQTFQLDAGPAFAGLNYGIIGSASGTGPGFFFGGFFFPLNIDPYFDFTLNDPAANALFTNRLGTLDGQGQATASFNLPASTTPFFDGLILNHIYAVVDAAQNLVTISNAVPVELSQDLFVVDAPVDSSTVGTSSVDICGRVGTALANATGLAVTVNGIAATLGTNSTGSQTFALRNQNFAPGSHSITIVASANGGLLDSQTISITVVSRPSNNVAIHNGIAYFSRGSAGFSAMRLSTRELVDFSVPSGTSSVDDLCLADGFLFVLDAVTPGQLTVFQVADDLSIVQVSGPVNVPVGPFAGVSAAAGRVVVSGGTSNLTVRNYNTTTGILGGNVAIANLGIGQPDVVVTTNGLRAFVSTDFAGSVGGSGFGITMIDLQNPPTAPTLIGRSGLPGSGFTGGLQGPANFPIESAVIDGLDTRVLTAHGGGLSVLRTNNPSLVTTQPLPFAATSVDLVGRRAFVVGGNQVQELDYTFLSLPVVLATSTVFTGIGSLTGVAADENFVAYSANAAGTIIRSR